MSEEIMKLEVKDDDLFGVNGGVGKVGNLALSSQRQSGVEPIPSKDSKDSSGRRVISSSKKGLGMSRMG
ncbi:MAG: hypothetical protein K5931_01535 [Lachnospiraceae bacterium]|nr:hypothetical protein [Lachnospiraceae bacterium]